MSDFNLVAACAFGLEACVKRELAQLGIDSRIGQPGRIAFTGDWSTLTKTNLWLRVADRVLIEVARFECKDFDALFETTKAIDWTGWLKRDSKFVVNGRSRNSQLTSVPACQRSVKRAIVDSLKAAYQCDLPETGAEYQIEIALLNDEAVLTIDTTGASLHKRGYRKFNAPAPLKESLAAALIQLSVWHADRPLVDPFCGSGTIPIEAALVAMNIAPGLHREFSFQYWPIFPQEVLVDLRSEATAAIDRSIALQIIGTDHDPEVLKLARLHAEAAGVADKIHFQLKSFRDLRSKREYGCVITNPPYGERLQEREELLPLYQEMPQVLQRLPSWSHFILTSVSNLESIVQNKATRRRKLYNGRIECTYFQFLGPRPPKDLPAKLNEPASDVLSDETTSAQPASELVDDHIDERSNARQSVDESKSTPQAVFGGLQPKDHEQAELFAARLKKRSRHLRRWPAKRDIHCFRLYEKDIPELPFVVDRYEDWLHITEYERPHDRDPGRHGAWRELMQKTAAAALEIPVQRVVMKSRERQRDKTQYQKLASKANLMEVREGGLKFLVNLTDYVDTGLFLDHRETRSMIRDEVKGLRFLNLFAYTGSFTVYAADGAAHRTVTLDTSYTYLEWAEKNLAANGFSGPQHEFVTQDAIEYLTSLPEMPMFDVVIADPPTFSNSKNRENSWNVQTDHPKLLNELAKRVSSGGVVYFSNNNRRFKLTEDALGCFSEIREISKQTVPEDFRNRRIHRCWRMVK